MPHPFAEPQGKDKTQPSLIPNKAKASDKVLAIVLERLSLVPSPIKQECMSDDDEDESVISSPHKSLLSQEEFEIEETKSEVNFYLKSKKKGKTRQLNKNDLSEGSRQSTAAKYANLKDVVSQEVHIKIEELNNHLDKCDQLHKPKNNEESFVCYNCLFQTGNKKLLEFHIIQMHLGPEKVQIYQCTKTDCAYWSHRKYDLAKHEMIHKPKNDRPKFKCSHCPFTVSTSTGLKQHQNKHNKSKIYKCPHCPYTTFWKNNLYYRHMFVHQAETYKCSKCDFGTKYKSGLRAHELIHNRQDKHWLACPKCPYKTIRKGHLQRHQLRHDNKAGDWFNCAKCPYKALMNKHLKGHMLTHLPKEQVKWFHCSKCPYKSNLERSLNTHMLIHMPDHEIEWFYCYNCSFRTKTKNSLRKHIIAHNKGKLKG